MAAPRAPRPPSTPKLAPKRQRPAPSRPAAAPEAPVAPPPERPAMPPVFTAWSAPLGLGVAAFYGLAARNGWVYDDYPLIVDAPAPQGLQGFIGLVSAAHWNGLPYYRPLSRLMLGAERALFGLEPAWYHALNAALMGLTATLAAALLRTPGVGVTGPAAALAALAVALHPAASEAVYPASVGPETLACFAVSLGAVLAWIRPGRRGLALALLALALLFKEQAAALPLLFAACDALDVSHDAPAPDLARWASRYAPVAALGAAWLALRASMINAPGPRFMLGSDPAGPLRSALYTAQTALLPRAELAYEPSVEGWLRAAHTVPALVVGAALGALAWRWRDELRAPLRFWGAWFVAAVLPTANIFRQETAYAERYVLFALPAAAGLAAALAAAADRRRHRAGTVALLMAVSALAGVAAWRARFYADQRTFLTQWSRTEPHPHRALATLGEEAHKRGQWAEAERLYREAYAAAPSYAGYVHAPLGQVLEAQGRNDEALAQYRAALRFFPNNQTARVGAARLGGTTPPPGDDAASLLNAGVQDLDAGRRDQAIARLREALRRAPVWQGSMEDRQRLRARAHYNLGNALNELGRADEAVSEYREAIREEPGYAYANTNLALILERRGEREEAARLFRAALASNPSLAIARDGLSRVAP